MTKSSEETEYATKVVCIGSLIHNSDDRWRKNTEWDAGYRKAHNKEHYGRTSTNINKEKCSRTWVFHMVTVLNHFPIKKLTWLLNISNVDKKCKNTVDPDKKVKTWNFTPFENKCQKCAKGLENAKTLAMLEV